MIGDERPPAARRVLGAERGAGHAGMERGRRDAGPLQSPRELVGEHHVGQLRLVVGASEPEYFRSPIRSSKSILPIDCAPDDTVTMRAGALAMSRSSRRLGQQERREVVEGERVLQTVGGDVAMRPEAADVVEQDVEPRVGREDLGGQPADLGLRRHVGDEDVDGGVARTRGRSRRRRARPAPGRGR